jgi:uncharacterized RDD family membrane protein YckC
MATMTQAPTTSLLPADVPVRIVARLIDAAVLTAFGLAFGRKVGFGFNWLIATAAVVLAYFVLADVLAGATLGKAVLRLHVIGQGGTKPTLKQAAVRESFILLGAVPFAGPFVALAAWIWIVVTIRSSPMRQGIHDHLAGTRVIRRETSRRPAEDSRS